MVDIAPKGLDHIAYLTWDTAATVAFYEDVLGMPLVKAIVEDKVPSVGVTDCRFVHTFFDMGEGQLLGFIEIEGLPPEQPDRNMPDWPRHIAFRLASMEALEQRRRDLVAKGVDVTAIHNHGPTSHSIYLHDPNGIRLEFTYAQYAVSRESAQRAHEVVRGFRQPASSTAPAR